MEAYDVLIVGGGAAGISAAGALWEAGCRSVALIDRKEDLGGILLQCVHTGFGPDLDGRAFAAELLRSLPAELPCFCGVTVTEIRPGRTVRLSDGRVVACRVLILAAGCREIPLGALPVTGTRPRGIYTAGQMQEMMNCHGFQPQGPAVILGSGDIGLIMAWQLGRIGLPVTVVEQADRMMGLPRNQERLAGLDIRFVPGTTIREIHGMPWITEVTLADGQEIPCQLLLTAVGLRPERELAEPLGGPDWILYAGNCSRIHPRIESVLMEGAGAAKRAVRMLRNIIPEEERAADE
ncbi:MAG: FAD-dependent oxidoreductase [Mogibacterium sp.]|nr:FAD-dependent oxidoreductase [Mogibacterium sp.]